ncbi:MAG: hypothetical protein E7A34_15275 [Leclercia adecarboxylata]|uniref:hypothetical protein n=1 Tax=Leclercia sp. G3L TaxID=2898725 RepID=UPI000EF03E5B|nr:hypothetical protein [Leclercia sp. G3L]MDU1060263.1 hypothetical protein [Leclercia adecarboxylata]MDU1085733.1 hypothetical protein [Leclercia adecarboxylata]UGB03866.1 hypothetical protein LRS40_07400 [Leclercia sp. G3L]HCN95577.1 hypothetical protein [Leclercia sp.]
MKNTKIIIFTIFIIAIGVGYIYMAARVFKPERYTQDDFFSYQLMTPEVLKRTPRVSNQWHFLSRTDEGSGLRWNEIVFTNINKNDATALAEQLDTWINNYPQRRDIMSVSIEESNGVLELRVIRYEMDKNK